MGDAAHTWGGDIDLDNVQVVPKKSLTQKSGSLKATEAGEDVVVREADLLRWSVTCLEIAGASTDHAESQVLKSSLCENFNFLSGKTVDGCRPAWPFQPWLQQACSHRQLISGISITKHHQY